LPVVYKREKQLYEAQELAVNALAGMQQQELNKAVKQVFNNMADLLERSKVLQRLDSIYARFLKAAELRFKTGETNTLEKTTAEAQMQQLKVQQQQLAADIGIWQMRLKAFLNTDELLLPDYNNFKRTGNLPGDTTISNHPEVQYRQQQQAVAAAETAIQKARLTPDFTLGYSNQSIIGYQSKDGVNQQYYGGGHRFNIYQLTMGIPIFNKPVKARIKAGQVSETVAALQTDATAQQLKSKMQELLQAFDKYNSQVHYYETTGLQQSETIIEHARQSFQHGDISYLEWTVLMNNAVTIQSGYLESVKQLNETIIELEYLTGK